MEFNFFHKDFFNATTGVYSRVTDREFYDSQITLTDKEADIIIKYFGYDNIHIGSVKSNTKKSLKKFMLYQIGSETFIPIYLHLLLLEQSKPTLRIFLSTKKRYKPKIWFIWFIYLNNNSEIVIGSLEERIWYSLGQIDLEDYNYQLKIQDALAKLKQKDI